MIRTLFVAASVLVMVPMACSGNNPAVLSADNVAIDLTDTVCAPLEAQTIGQPWVDFVCTLAEGAEDIIAQAEAAPAATDAGLVAFKGGTKPAKTIKIRIPAGEATAFMATHRIATKKNGGK